MYVIESKRVVDIMIIMDFHICYYQINCFY